MHLQDYCTDVNEINGKGSRGVEDGCMRSQKGGKDVLAGVLSL